MTKKLWLFILSVITLLWFLVSFADVIPDNSHYLKRCSKLKDAEIDKYKVVYTYIYEKWPDWCWQGPENICQLFGDGEPEFIWIASEYNTERCLPVWNIKIYLLDETESTNFLTQDNINEKAIYVWSITVKEWGYVNNSNPLTSETLTYGIIKIWSNYALWETDVETIEWFNNKPFTFTENEDNYDFEIIWDEENVRLSDDKEDIKSLDDEYTGDGTNYTLKIVENGQEIMESEQDIELVNKDRLIKFWIAWIITILVETMVLFLIVKICRRSWSIKNRKIIVTWILASTVTLPLLWFVLPIFFNNYWVYVIFGEILVTAIEVFIIKYSLKVERKMAIFASIVCNLCSFLFWLLVF